MRRTDRALVVEQGARRTSYGAWLGDEISRRLFDCLDAPGKRLEASPSRSTVREPAAIARTDEVLAAL
ncbi:hypothetical protein AB0L14_33020 [Streptomyces sp. NPDC052727]|uniref:hypothetical protein n=1 Tax=Streptomyces sp. NPDC052727 TaxID=3154854 RepID=UPI003414702C